MESIVLCVFPAVHANSVCIWGIIFCCLAGRNDEENWTQTAEV